MLISSVWVLKAVANGIFVAGMSSFIYGFLQEQWLVLGIGLIVSFFSLYFLRYVSIHYGDTTVQSVVQKDKRRQEPLINVKPLSQDHIMTVYDSILETAHSKPTTEKKLMEQTKLQTKQLDAALEVLRERGLIDISYSPFGATIRLSKPET